jgi:hypothetical protein
MKYIDDAMLRLKNKSQSVNETELSLVERILANESDPKTAYILALDLILVGIDTDTVCKNLFMFILIMKLCD